MTSPVDISTLIERDAADPHGRLRIAGTSVTVARIAELAMEGLSAEQISSDVFSDQLPLAAIHAALAYFYANRPAIEAELSRTAAAHDEVYGQVNAARRTA